MYQNVWVSKFYKDPLQNRHVECWSTFQRMKIPVGRFQVCDALGILFEFEKPPVEHLEVFILLPKEGGELQKFFKTFDSNFQLKNLKEFRHWISKSWRISGGRNACSSSNELLRGKVYWGRYGVWIIRHNPVMCNCSLQCSLRGGGDGYGVSWIGNLGDTQNPWRMLLVDIQCLIVHIMS